MHHRPALAYLALITTLLCSPAFAAKPTVGDTIPELLISEHGELILQKNSPAFQPWSTTSLTDGRRMHVLMYIAPTLGASRLNKPFTDALDQQGFGFDQVLPTSIINVSQAPWGAAGIVMRELTHNKRKYPQSILVADTLGLGRSVWELQPGSYAVFILDSNGKVLFFKDGALIGEEVAHAMQLLRSGVQQQSSRTQ